jgi:probable HAF family extracellular repeat protein
MKSQYNLVAAVVLLMTVAANAQIRYKLIGLGTLGGLGSYAYCINDEGQVVGYALIPSGKGHAVLFDTTGGGANVDLGAPSGKPSAAYCINNLGQIVGHASANTIQATLFDPTGGGDNLYLGSLFPSDWSAARSINNEGQIVGSGHLPGTHETIHAALFDPSGAGDNIDLGTLGGSQSGAQCINDLGQIVGHARTSANRTHATLFDPTGGRNNRDLGTLPGGEYSLASSINNIGQVVGRAYTTPEVWHATLFNSSGNGNNLDLGILPGTVNSQAHCINDLGQIVGLAQTASRKGIAVLFDANGTGNNIDLNTLIDPDLGWKLWDARGINNHGQIVGYGTNPAGYGRAFLLNPLTWTEVAVDIKPGTCPNPVNVRSKGVLLVAILGSEEFDVTDVDVASIQLAGVGPLRSGYEDIAAPVLDTNDCNCTEEGPDGFLDLTLKFKIQRIIDAVGDVNSGDELQLELIGVLFDETHIKGADCILIRGRHKPINSADINKDGVVNVADFAIFAQNWLQSSIVDE